MINDKIIPTISSNADTIECWTIKQMDNRDYIRSMIRYISPREKDYMITKGRVEPLFNIGIISLKKRG